MIHAAIFATTDPAERATLIVTGAPDQIALNTPPGGCWRKLPAGVDPATVVLSLLDAAHEAATVSSSAKANGPA